MKFKRRVSGNWRGFGTTANGECESTENGAKDRVKRL